MLASPASREQNVYDTLRAWGIPYERHAHGTAMTMADLLDVDTAIGEPHCKNLFLTNKRDYYLLLMPGGKKFRTAEVGPQIPSSRLSFAGEDKLGEYLGIEGGAIGPMGLINDAARAVRLLIDRDLREAARLVVHPNVNTASIVLSGQDFFGVFLKKTGHVPRFVTLGQGMAP